MIKVMDKKVPDIRFKEFDDEWAKIRNGNTAKCTLGLFKNAKGAILNINMT